MGLVLASPSATDLERVLMVLRAHARSRRRTTSRLLYGLSALCVGLALVSVAGQPAHAVSDGSDWGAAGATAPTDSAVTVSWDNGGSTPAADVVPRDATQVLPHTAGKTYLDTDADVRFGVKKDFGSMTLSVSQTTGLVHQGVTVSYTGVVGGGTSGNGSRLNIMQCWGDAAVAQPDPDHCQTGVGGVDGNNNATQTVAEDDVELRNGGDAPRADLMQFVDRAGTTTTKDFTKVTTNEFTNFAAPAKRTETATRSFEVQTGAEAPGLGCGYRADVPSTATCWLVAIPINGDLYGNYGSYSAVTPSLWAQRLQVKLAFAPVASSCGGGSRELTFGSELLSDAMASWIPALCDTAKVAAGFGVLGDPQARAQLASQTSNFVFTSAPAPASAGTVLYAPVALSAVTIGVNASNSNTGQPVSGIKLNARLVAKLITESYASGIDTTSAQLAQKAPWVAGMLPTLAADPEFRALNPTLPYGQLLIQNDLVVTSTQSDAATAVWSWLLHDPAAKAFLDGCPDDASGDSVINPFYSTRSYAECADKASSLEATAKADRTATKVPSTYQDQAAVYPPTGAAFPQPGFFQHDAAVNPPTKYGMYLELSLANIHPREATLLAAGNDAARGFEPSNTAWCPDVDGSVPACQGAPGTYGKYINASAPYLGSGVFGLTDTNTAARALLPTAALCDVDGSHCVGADSASLTVAAKAFQPTTVPGVGEPAAHNDYAAGAYPLTLPVFAEIATKGLLAADAKAYAKILGYVSTTGQRPGHTAGSLPPGYAPLTDSMVATTAATITALDEIRDPPLDVPQASPNVATSGDVPETTPVVPDTATVPDSAPVASASDAPVAAGGGGAVANPQAVAAAGKTPATPVGFSQFGLVTGLGGALAAGVAAPLVGRKRKGVLG